MPGAATLAGRDNIAFFTKGDTIAFDLAHGDNGTALAKGIKIFKVGTFRDSLGTQHTWTPEHLQQMVFHFDMLKDTDILPNVPWRLDHSMSVKNVAGYFEKLYVEGGFLLADVNFSDPDVVTGMTLGKYRSRSLEVGVYETNDEAFYWPVVTGCAFVDLPAVEGLYSKAQPVSRTLLYEAPNRMEDNKIMFVINGKTVTAEVWTAAVNYAKALADLDAVPAADLTAAQTAVTEAQAAAAAAAAHSQGKPATFQVNGQPTVDVVAVQNQITMLETFRVEAVEAGKAAFVQGLAAQSKLAATQIDSQVAFVKSLTDAQYDEYKKSWEAAPASALFGIHGKGPGEQADASQGGGNAGPTELETLTEIVATMRRSGMKDEMIAKTESFKKMTALTAAGK